MRNGRKGLGGGQATAGCHHCWLHGGENSRVRVTSKEIQRCKSKKEKLDRKKRECASFSRFYNLANNLLNFVFPQLDNILFGTQ